MARHKVGEYRVEVVHRLAKPDGKTEVILVVFKERKFLAMAGFDYLAFNTAELRRRLKVLEAFPARAFDAVVEDAREWPKDGAKVRRTARKTRP